MAEIWSTAEKVAKLVFKEAESLHKVKNEVESVKKKLKSMGSKLEEADIMIDRDEKFDEWASELRELAFKAEDVIEVFVNNATLYDEEDCCAIFQLIMGCFHQISTLHKLRNEINDINGKLEELSKQSPQIQKGSPDDGETSTRHRPGKDWASIEIDEEDIVGFQKEEGEVTSWLTREEPRGRPVAFSIWAQGGAGKSTLALKIYKSSFVRNQFDCVAWVSVSQEYHVKDIWQAILEQVGQLTPMEETEAIVRKKVNSYLKEKNYLIILDDLWKPEDLDIIQDFPKSSKTKCRFLLTTRDEEVARRAGPNRLHLRILNPEESMELFLKRVYPFSPEDIPSVPKEMKDLAREMLSEWCEGLPIAIVLLGGILSSKEKDPMVWGNIRDKVHSDLVNEGGHLRNKVLALSYNQLPYELRSCFLYFGLFPEDSLINCDRLIRLWVAEGFSEQGDDHIGQAKEDVAGEYLKRLIERSMIQVVERKSNGDPQTCRTHDLIRDLAMKEGKKAKFLSISMEKHIGSLSVESNSRRIALHGRLSTVPIQSKASRMRVPRPRVVEREGLEDDVVGFQEEADALARSLTKEVPLGRLAVVSIVADAGFGKTALARKVYNRNDVKSHFGNYRAWVYVSAKGVEVKHVLRTILQQFKRRLTDAEIELKEEEEELQRMVHNLLEGKNYLIVFDNLLQTEYWDAIKMVFPNEPLMNKDQKCRVLVTTRHKEVAHYVDPSSSPSCLELGYLNEDLRLKLFLKTILECSSQDEIPAAILGNKEMIDIARKMVGEYSDRLPFSILALGSFLSREEKDTCMWTNVCEHLSERGKAYMEYWGMIKDDRLCFEKVFSLCYVGLPDYLASCIRYFNSLSLDSEISCDILMRSWVEQGFLESVDGNYAMEDVARDCLEELIQRKLIDVVEWRSTGDPQTCRMQCCFHSLMVYKMGELDYERVKGEFHWRGSKSNNRLGLVQVGDNTRSEESEVDCRTSSTSTTTAIGAPPQHYYSQQPKRSSKVTFSLSHLLSKILAGDPFKFPNYVYSLLCFSKNPNFSALKEFHLLRVVDLQGAENILELPNDLRNLTLLRYLSLRGTGVKVIPPWIANLRNLQTLDAPASKIPVHIVSLHQLRHLFAHSFHSPPPLPVDHMNCDSSSSSCNINIGILEHLHTLELLGDHHKGDLVIDGLDKLTNLRVLRICVDNCDGVSMSSAIANLTGLKFLRLTRSHKTKYGWSWLSFSRHSCLDEMILENFSFPMPNDFPPRLTFLWLDLEGGHCDVNLFSTLQQLSFLKKLCLRVLPEWWEVFSYTPMTCSTKGFPKLEYLYIRVNHTLKEWNVEPGALRSLRVLHIHGQHQLRNLPDGLRHVTNLKELIITRCYDVRWSILNRRGRAWEIVKGIGASIKFLDDTTVNPPP